LYLLICLYTILPPIFCHLLSRLPWGVLLSTWRTLPVPVATRLRRRSTAARLLRSWFRIPPRAWMFVCCVCCQVAVSATSWSLVQRNPTECGASLCMIKKPRDTRRPYPALGCRARYYYYYYYYVKYLTQLFMWVLLSRTWRCWLWNTVMHITRVTQELMWNFLCALAFYKGYVFPQNVDTSLPSYAD
jgi:hypothetical protein